MKNTLKYWQNEQKDIWNGTCIYGFFFLKYVEEVQLKEKQCAHNHCSSWISISYYLSKVKVFTTELCHCFPLEYLIKGEIIRWHHAILSIALILGSLYNELQPYSISRWKWLIVFRSAKYLEVQRESTHNKRQKKWHLTVPSLNNNNNNDALLPLRLHKIKLFQKMNIFIRRKNNNNNNKDKGTHWNKGYKIDNCSMMFSDVQRNFFGKWADDKANQRIINIQICNHNPIGRFHLYIYEENKSNDMQCWCYVNWRVFLLFISILRIS